MLLDLDLVDATAELYAIPARTRVQIRNTFTLVDLFFESAPLAERAQGYYKRSRLASSLDLPTAVADFYQSMTEEVDDDFITFLDSYEAVFADTAKKWTATELRKIDTGLRRRGTSDRMRAMVENRFRELVFYQRPLLTADEAPIFMDLVRQGLDRVTSAKGFAGVLEVGRSQIRTLRQLHADKKEDDEHEEEIILKTILIWILLILCVIFFACIFWQILGWILKAETVREKAACKRPPTPALAGGTV